MLFLFLLWSILGCHRWLLQQTACHSVPCCHLEVKHWSGASGDIREQNLQDPHLPVSVTLPQKTLGCPKSVSSRISFSVNKVGLDIVVSLEPCPYFTVVVILFWFCFPLLLFLRSRNSGSTGWPQKVMLPRVTLSTRSSWFYLPSSGVICICHRTHSLF